jgi:hypothetical protein
MYVYFVSPLKGSRIVIFSAIIITPLRGYDFFAFNPEGIKHE